MKKVLVITLSMITVLLFQACLKSDGDLNQQRLLKAELLDHDYNNDDYPSHMQSISFNLDNEVVKLGRVLFYDEILSANERISCGTCHHQNKGFSDGQATSAGFAMQQTPRNSMSLGNNSMQSRFFWDIRTSSLNEQVLMPIMNHIEMGQQDLNTLVTRIESKDYYMTLFTNAFGTGEVSIDRISDALVEFISALRSYENELDNAIPEDSFGSLWGGGTPPNFPDPAAQRGFELFGDLGCNSCHSGSNVGGNGSAANIGLDMVYTDAGVASWSGDAESIGAFKIPSLRNVALTAPYMHDGRFDTLDEVIEHYNSGIQAHPNLNWNLTTTGFISLQDLLESGIDPTLLFTEASEEELFENLEVVPMRFNLTASDKANLKVFLESLTDLDFVNDPRFADPFVVEKIQ